MNDDFLYKRQEAPDPAFVAQMQALLKLSEVPAIAIKAKRKNGQSRVNWKLLVATFMLTLLGASSLLQPEIRNPIMSGLFGTGYEDSLQIAQEDMDVKIPQVPLGYGLSSAQVSSFDESYMTLTMLWTSYRNEHCVIRLTVYHSPQAAEDMQSNINMNAFLAGIHDWVKIEPLNEEIDAVWRMQVTVDNYVQQSLQWYLGYNDYNLEIGELCLSQEDLVSIAQSTLP